MIDTNTNNQLHDSESTSTPLSSNGSNDMEKKNYRNRANSKVKLLVRSHAIREATSPPRDPQNGPNIHSNQTLSEKKNFSNNLQTNVKLKNTKHHQFNNNESMYNSNLSAMNQSPKKLKNSIISPSYQISSKTCIPSQQHQKNLIVSNNNNTFNNQRAQQNALTDNSKCTNCIKNDQHDKLILLETPTSPPISNNLQDNEQKNQNNDLQSSNSMICNNQYSTQCSNNISVNRSNFRHNIKRQNSFSQEGSYNTLPFLSRDNSTDLYKDNTGIDLQQFIADTINRNKKDRSVLLKIEKELIEFAKDKQKISHKFPNMSSYNRMLVHRVAAYFGMEHNVDQSGLSVIVTRTKNMRIPETRFKKHIRDDLLLTEEPRRSILKRDTNSFEDTFSFKSPDRLSGNYCRRSKSFEEREEEYERARRRIFKDSNNENGDVTTWRYWSSENSKIPSRYRLLHPSDHSIRQSRILKGESLDIKDSLHSNYLQPSVSKSYSFDGYTREMLSRVDSVMSTRSANGRLIKQDSGVSSCSHLSPSSSGYKSQSQRSDATISPSPSPSPIPNITSTDSEISNQDLISSESNSETIIWAVTSISCVPPGSVIINPQTNQPYINRDGSLYRFDPNNPPKIFMKDTSIQGVCVTTEESKPSESHKLLLNNKIDNAQNQQSHKLKYNSNCNSSVTSTLTTSITPRLVNETHLNNSATCSKVPITSLTPSLPLPSSPVTLELHHHHYPRPRAQKQHQHQQSKNIIQQRQPIVRTISVQPRNCNRSTQSYATCVPNSKPSRQNIYQYNMTQRNMMMTPYSVHGPPGILNNRQEDVYSQNSMFTNYTLPVQYTSIPQSVNTNDLTNCFMGINIHDQRSTGDNQTPLHPYSTHRTFVEDRTSINNIQSTHPNYWQTSANQMAMQQTMYFVYPPGHPTLLSFNHNQGDRQQLSQQQRLSLNYSMNLQMMNPTYESNDKYMDNYLIPYNPLSTITSSSSEYMHLSTVQMVPNYYQRQSEIQPSSVVYKIPTMLNTPNTNQVVQ